MKRGLVFACISLILLFFLISSVSAAYYLPPVRYVVQNVIDTWVDTLEPILQSLFGGYGWSSYLLFERFLLFVVLISVVYIAVGRVPLLSGQKVVKWIIAIIVPLIGMRFIDFEWLNAILLQYRVVAIVLVAALPFFLFFFFLTGIFPGAENAFMRKLAWLLFALIYAGLWSTAENQTRSEIFFWTMIVSFIFIFLDGYVERMLHMREIKKGERNRIAELIADVDDKIQKIDQSGLSAADKKEKFRELNERRKFWSKKLAGWG